MGRGLNGNEMGVHGSEEVEERGAEAMGVEQRSGRFARLAALKRGDAG